MSAPCDDSLDKTTISLPQKDQEASQETEGRRAGLVLVDLASKDSGHASRRLVDYERDLIDQSFARGIGFEEFHKHYLRALRTALKTLNLEVAKVLLSRNVTHELLNNESDILQLAISLWDQVWLRNKQQPLYEIIGLLLAHGAGVDSLDERGNSALYWTCVNGLSEVFKLLMAFGADCTTLHDSLPNTDLEAPSSTSPTQTLPKVNLLRIALDARLRDESGRSIPWIWTENLETGWCYIIFQLMNTGLSYGAQDPSLVKVLHIACHQGNLAAVEYLLDSGVDATARAGRSDDRDYIYGSALHAALAGDQKDIAACLLEHGLDPKAKGLNTSLNKSLKEATPIQAAFEWSVMGSRQPLDACEHLINAGVDREDCELVLTECVKRGHLEMAARLLQRGTRIPRMPISDSLDMVQLFEGTCGMEPAELQRHAAGKGSLDLLKYLVSKYGKRLPVDDFGFMAFDILRGNHMDTLRYLVTEYGFDVNGTFLLHAQAGHHINFLQRACQEHHTGAVKLLLEEGADPACPGLEDTAIEYMHKQESSYVFSVQRFATKILPIIRLLVDSNKDVGVSVSDDWSTKIAQLRCSADQEPALMETEGFTSPWEIVKSDNLEEPSKMSLICASPSESDNERDSVVEEHEQPKLEEITESSESVEFKRHLISQSGQRFEYQPLQRLGSIRLIELHPSQSTRDPITCSMLHCDLAQKPEFEAVIYAPGLSKDRIMICLDGEAFGIEPRLWASLVKLRLGNDVRRLWIDTISINQGDTEERNRQSVMMRDIYHSAKHTIVWTGEERDNSQLVFQHIRKWNDDREAYARDRKDGKEHECAFSHCDHINPPHFSGPAMEAYEKLCQRPIFYHAWLIPATVFAEKVIAKCGEYQVPFKQLVRSSSFLMYGLEYHPLSGPHGRSRLQQLYDISKQSRIASVAAFSRPCQTSDPRDKVYPLSYWLKNKTLAIDYSLSVARVYRNFTQNVIEEMQDLEALEWHGTQRKRSDLPSWVPDYSVSKPAGALPNVWGSYTQRIVFPAKLLSGWHFDGNDLIVKGKFVETIGATSNELIANDAHKLGSAGMRQVLRRWERLAASLTNKRFTRAIPDAFADTLLAYENNLSYPDKEKPELSSNAPRFVVWYGRYGAQVLRELDPKYFRDIELFHSWAGDRYKDKDREHDIDRYTHDLEYVCYGRKLFITREGSMGLAPPQAQAGDPIVFIPGSKYPFVLRKRNDGAYRFVGDCYLYDLDIYSIIEDETKDVEEFRLR